MTSPLVPLQSPETPPHSPQAAHQHQQLDHKAPDTQHSPPLTDPEGKEQEIEEQAVEEREKEKEEKEWTAAGEADLTTDVREIVHLFQQRVGRRPRPRSSSRSSPRLPGEPDAVFRRSHTSPAALAAAFEHIRACDPPTWRHLRHELRWEYCVRTQTLQIRMPSSSFHDSICDQVQLAVDKRMRRAIKTCAALTSDARSHALALWDEKMQRTRSAEVSSRSRETGADPDLPLLSGHFSPDASWRPHDAATAVAVLEVAWSEDVSHWKDKCAGYIEFDHHSTVRTVLGVKCDYLGAKDLATPRTRVLLYKRWQEEAEEDGKDYDYGLEAWGPRDVSGKHTFHLRLIDFVPWSTVRTVPDIQQWSDHVGDVAFPLTLFKDIVRRANLLRQPLPPSSVPTGTGALGKRRFRASEEPELEEDAAEAPASSFESVEGEASGSDPGYRPTSTANSTMPVRRSSARLKRLKAHGNG